jgi:hypothetical protein
LLKAQVSRAIRLVKWRIDPFIRSAWLVQIRSFSVACY